MRTEKQINANRSPRLQEPRKQKNTKQTQDQPNERRNNKLQQ